MAAQAFGVGLKRSVNPPKDHPSAEHKTFESNLSMSGKIHPADKGLKEAYATAASKILLPLRRTGP